MNSVKLEEIVDNCRTSYGFEAGELECNALVAKVSNITEAGHFHRDFESRSFTEQELEQLRAKPGDLFVVKSSGSKKRILSGKTAMVTSDSPTPLIASNFLLQLRPKFEYANPKYLWYYLNSSWSKAYVKTIVGAFTYPNLKWSTYRKHPIPLPPLPEQKRIAAILDAADELRTKRRESLRLLDDLIQSTFLEMFGDPVTNPMGWRRCKFGDYIQVLTDYHANGSYATLRKHVKIKNSIDYALMIRTTDLESESYSSDNIYISEDAYNFLEKSKVYGGEVIINKIGSAGRVYLMPVLGRPVSLGMNALLIRMKSPLNNIFAYYYLTSKYGYYEIKKRVKGAVTKTIRKDAVRDIPFLLPSNERLDSFNTAIESINQQKARLQSHLDELDTLFASLQQRAFNGEL